MAIFYLWNYLMSSTNGNTIEHDNYQTPQNAIDALLKLVELRDDDDFLEPCRGTERRIFDAVNLPDDQKFWCEIQEDRDYLASDLGKKFDVIITNPPFSLSEEFVRKMRSELKPDGTLIFLQRVNFLGSRKRIPFWGEVGFPHKAPILIPRPKFAKGGTDSCEYCWYIFDYGNRTTKIPSAFSHVVAETPKKQSKIKTPRTRKPKTPDLVTPVTIEPVIGIASQSNTSNGNPFLVLEDF